MGGAANHSDSYVQRLLVLEQEARNAARNSDNCADRDSHLIAAERHADEAWSLAEKSDHAFVPSPIWSRQALR